MPGWGTTSYGGQVSDPLLQVSVKVLSTEHCRQFPAIGSKITDNMFCTYEDGKDACQGQDDLLPLHNAPLGAFISRRARSPDSAAVPVTSRKAPSLTDPQPCLLVSEAPLHAEVELGGGSKKAF